MNSRRPSHDLKAFQRDYAAGRVRITDAASNGRRALGFTMGTAKLVIAGIKANEFYKTMESYDGSGMQDVYRTSHEGYRIYVKFTADVVTQFSLLSFKAA